MYNIYYEVNIIEWPVSKKYSTVKLFHATYLQLHIDMWEKRLEWSELVKSRPLLYRQNPSLSKQILSLSSYYCRSELDSYDLRV